MNDDAKLLCYSLLASFNDSGVEHKNILDFYVPLVMTAVELIGESGGQLSDIREKISTEFGLVVPEPILKKITARIKSETVSFFADGSFVTNGEQQYLKSMGKQKTVLTEIERTFEQYLTKNNIDCKTTSVATFFTKNALSACNFLFNSESVIHDELTDVEKIIYNFLYECRENEVLFSQLSELFRGAILTKYIEFEFDNALKKDVELVLDTTIILAALGLSSKKLQDSILNLLFLAQKLGYRFTVLDITIQEAQNLLSNTCSYLTRSLTAATIYEDSIEAACARNKYGQSDLIRISKNLENKLREIIDFKKELVTDEFKKEAQTSEIYKKLESSSLRRTNPAGFEHDAYALFYVEKRRLGNNTVFEEINCWFLINYSGLEGRNVRRDINNGFHSQINYDVLLTILWLCNPLHMTKENARTQFEQRIVTIVSGNLPSVEILRKLDSYLIRLSEEKISDEDLALLLHSNAFKSVEKVNELICVAEENEAAFCDKILELSSVSKHQLEEEKQHIYDDNILLKERNAEQQTIIEKKSSVIASSNKLLEDLLNRETQNYDSICVKIDKNNRKSNFLATTIVVIIVLFCASLCFISSFATIISTMCSILVVIGIKIKFKKQYTSLANYINIKLFKYLQLQNKKEDCKNQIERLKNQIENQKH